MVCKLPSLALAGALAVLMSTAAHAGAITSAASRVALGGNDSLTWGTGADDGSIVASPFTRTSAGGVGVTASTAGSTDLALFVQGAGTYSSNYAAGDVVLDTFFTDTTISLGFSSAIRGVGFNIAADANSAFTGFLRFYGAGNVLFDEVSVAGLSDMSGDGSAAFLGGTSSLRDILRVDIWVTTTSTADFSINQLSLLTTDPRTDSTVPEPGALALGAVALAAAAAARRRSSSGATA
jgi:MYXO-CTERM domain-containing protein